jgi:predicted nucleic acid-binding Zn ribbon protein
MSEKEERIPVETWITIVNTAEATITKERLLNEKKLALYDELLEALKELVESHQELQLEVNPDLGTDIFNHSALSKALKVIKAAKQ